MRKRELRKLADQLAVELMRLDYNHSTLWNKGVRSSPVVLVHPDKLKLASLYLMERSQDDQD